MNKNRSILERSGLMEEIINCITHGIGVIFGIISLIVLLSASIKTGDTKSIVGFSIYGSCLIIMYLSSALYHGIPFKKVKEILRVFDHSSIFLFIAGTYTPIALLTLKGNFRIISLTIMWSIAIGGIIFKIWSFGKFDKYKILSTLIYIGMGWITLFSMKQIIQKTSVKFVLWLVAGGLIYTLGTLFYSNKKIPYNHAIWHLFVLGGSVAHFVGIYRHLL